MPTMLAKPAIPLVFKVLGVVGFYVLFAAIHNDPALRWPALALAAFVDWKAAWAVRRYVRGNKSIAAVQGT